MDHSVEGYLRRQSDDRLEKFLQQYTQLSENEYYAYLIKTIKTILEERKHKN